MAIKISGTTVIDNSRNGTNLATVTASSFVKSGGTSSQFLKADGSSDSSSFASTGKAIAMALIFGWLYFLNLYSNKKNGST